VHGRLTRIEGALQKETETNSEEVTSAQEAVINFRNEQIAMREELESLKQQSSYPQAMPDATLHSAEENAQLASAMTAQIDARFREIFSHFQGEILKLKGQLVEELSALKLGKVDRTEINSRFARIATAALEEQDLSEEMKNEGFLL